MFVTHTNPNSPDTFGSLPDAWLALNGLTSANGQPGMDPDLDGLVNLQEYNYGSRPLVSEGTAIWVNGAGLAVGVP